MERFSESIAHVDMDAFFVEVERLRRPELKGKAVLVGGAGGRGVVASASYEARARGVQSAMPMVQARRLCPHAVVVTPDHGAYSEVSTLVVAVLESFTPHLEQISVDEAFLDISGLRLLFEGPAAVGDAIRAAMRRELDLPCSVGIAPTKLLAKMASRDAKPDGMLIVHAESARDYLRAKPVRALWGVGEATHARLEELGVATVGDIADYPRETLVRRLGDSLGSHLWDLASGSDPRRVEPADGGRTISVEQTFETDLTSREDMERELLAHADRLATRLRRSGYVATTVQLKVRYGDFTTVTRSHTVDHTVSTARDLYRIALELLDRTDAARRPVRLLGLGTDGLVGSGEPRQLGLGPRSWEDLEAAVESVRRRFGGSAVERARLLDRGESRRRPPSDQ